MPELIAKSPLSGVWPVAHGNLRLSEHLTGSITSLATMPGQEKALARNLKQFGLTFPRPNTFVTSAGATLVWTGRNQAFLFGFAPPELAGAALTDQSDGWATLQLEGQSAADALMRLYPLDLRAQSFAPGAAVRAPLNHMQSVLMRTAPDMFKILVFRSMARTAWHEVEQAMKTLYARALLG